MQDNIEMELREMGVTELADDEVQWWLLVLKKMVPFIEPLNNCRLFRQILYRAVGCTIFNVRTKHFVWQ